MTDTSPIIAASGLTKRFGRLTAVDGLDLEVSRGEVFGFLGPNGAGKSTTLRMMVGLIRPTRGEVRLFGQDVWRRRCRALSSVGALIESPAFYKYLSGRDNLRILSNMGADHPATQIDQALDTVGLLDRADDKVKAYSQGMRQRLGIALAIVGNPELVLLDEPTNGLDPQGMKEVRDLIKRLSSELGMTVFLSSHLLNEVEQVCTRIAVVNHGKVIESGAVRALLGHSRALDVTLVTEDGVLEAISSLGWVTDARLVGETLSVQLLGGSAAQLNRFLVERGFEVAALVPRKTSLEELYLQLVGGENGKADQV